MDKNNYQQKIVGETCTVAEFVAALAAFGIEVSAQTIHRYVAEGLIHSIEDGKPEALIIATEFHKYISGEIWLRAAKSQGVLWGLEAESRRIE